MMFKRTFLSHNKNAHYRGDCYIRDINFVLNEPANIIK
ncbi:MAG: hypothetical protein ACI9JN_001387 [Bacteroidia bacterium]|jgi:hypothetical protein